MSAVTQGEALAGPGLPPHLSGRIAELDGLRGIAIAMVLVHHYFLQQILPPAGSLLSYVQAAGRLSWSGVDLFFVLSGFLIGGILLDARQSHNYFRVFYTRRFFRIAPMYGLVLAVALGLYALGPLGMTHRFDRTYAQTLPWISYALFLQNFWMAYGTVFGALTLTVTWSLAVEEQFYLTLPPLIRRLSMRWLLVALGAGIVFAPLSRLALYALWPSRYLARYMLMPCRADALLLGVLGAVALRDLRWRARLEANRGIMLFVLAILASGVVVLTKLSQYAASFPMLSVGFTWLAGFYLCALLCAVLFRGSWLSGCLRWRWLRWLGSIAYGVYLLHELVREVLFSLLWPGPRLLVSPWEILATIAALGITLFICRVSWVYFEKPLVQLGHRARYRFDTPTAASALAGAEASENTGYQLPTVGS